MSEYSSESFSLYFVTCTIAEEEEVVPSVGTPTDNMRKVVGLNRYPLLAAEENCAPVKEMAHFFCGGSHGLI